MFALILEGFCTDFALIFFSQKDFFPRKMSLVTLRAKKFFFSGQKIFFRAKSVQYPCKHYLQKKKFFGQKKNFFFVGRSMH